MRIVIRNELLPEERKETLLYILAGRREQTFVQTLSSQYCGRLDCSIGELRTVDYLGLFSFRRKTDGLQCHTACHTALVLPSVYPLKETDNDSKIQQDAEGGESSPKKAGDDPSELFDIREYREGDRLTHTGHNSVVRE